MSLISSENSKIKRGDCILTEEPFVYVLKSSFRLFRCECCLYMKKVLKCSNCQYVFYCGKECQKKSWFFHKYECPMLKKVFPRTVPDAARMLCKIIIRLHHGGNLVRGFFTKNSSRTFKDLMSHCSEIKNDSKRMEHLETLYQILREMMQDFNILPSKLELLRLYGKLVINGFNILDGEMNSLGTGIYLGASIVDHSCIPNAVATFEGTLLNIYALEDIEHLDWSKIYISYVDLLNTTEDRKLTLKHNYYFVCICNRCTDAREELEMNAAACPNNGCNNIININSQYCEHCNTEICSNYQKEFHEIVNFTKFKLNEMGDAAYLDVCKLCLRKQENYLHKMNIWRVKTLDLAFEAAIILEKWTEALQYAVELLPGFKKYNGDWNPLVGLLYLKIGKIQVYMEKINDARKNLEKAREILEVTHGRYHSLLKSQLYPLLMQTN